MRDPAVVQAIQQLYESQKSGPLAEGPARPSAFVSGSVLLGQSEFAELMAHHAAVEDLPAGKNLQAERFRR
jgi:hypothetical protein